MQYHDNPATVEQALENLEISVQDVVGDNPEVSVDDIYHDCVVNIAWEIADDGVALELCRRTLGSVPYDLEARLGRKDWVQ